MILFCDTSALVKLYIEEASSDRIQAPARRVGKHPADAEAIETSRTRLPTDWPHHAMVEIARPVVEIAGV